VDHATRAKIDAVKSDLVTWGLADVEDPPEVQVRPEYHTIRAAIPAVPATHHKHFRFLSLAYGWLQKRGGPQDAVTWLRQREIAQRLQRDEREIDVLESGETRSVLLP
jgi:hypothetical protein